MRRISAYALVLFVALCTATGFAQNATTSLRGVVKDPSGAVVPGATITLENKSVGQKITVMSKGSGEYQALELLPAKYVVTVTATGFGSQSKAAELLVNQPATINFELSVKESTEVVDVTAAAQTLNTIDASLGASFSASSIEDLPSESRNIPDLLSLQPGVLFLPNDGTSRTGAVNGGRSDQGNVTVDGIDDNDQVNGYAFTGVLRETQDSTEEFRVTTAGATADAGRSSGAQVSLLTKAGSNKYHGSVYEYNRTTNTVSNNFFNKQAQLESQSACFAALPSGATSADIAACNAQGNRPPKVIRNIYGADASGFIVKNKLFFFANYEATRKNESEIVQQTVPTALYQQGIVQYYSNGALVQISPSQFTALDTANGCAVCGAAAYPNPPGANPNALAYLNSMPAANGTLLGDGLNEGSYTFSSPLPTRLNTSIVKLDYTPSEKHRIFVRGNLQKDDSPGTQQFPGLPPSTVGIENNKGIAAGDTWTITPNLVNDLRYGYTRQGAGSTGVGTGDYVDFRFLNTPTSESRSSITSVPVNNIVDNFNIIKGKHSIELGVNWRLIHQNRLSDGNSYSGASTNPYWLRGNPPDPSTIGLPPVDTSFGNSYEIAYANLVGTVPSVTDVYNYAVSSSTSGTLLADGTPIERHFKANEYEGFIQDSWRALPNLTITAGVRYTVLQTPWETKGQEVTPSVPSETAGGPSTDTHTWYQKRESEALQGNVYEPDLVFAPAGPYYNKPGFYSKSKNNFAPRLAVVFSPDPKTTFRAGAGIYYDHFGEGLVNIFDQEGEFGLSTSVTNPAGVQTIAGAPRFTGRNDVPFGINPLNAPTTTSYPYTAPQGNFAITWGLDSKIKTPYSEVFNASIQHEFPAGLTFELDYVGRLGKHLLQSLDLAEPVDYVDPQQGGDYYTAGSALSKQVDLHGGDQFASVSPIPYFENVFSFMANNPNVAFYDNNGNLIYSGLGHSATQNVYTAEWAPYRAQYGATTSLSDIDFFCYYGCPDGYQSKFWQDQFSSLYALSSIGKSYYNAAQFVLRHPSSHGVTFDVSYTFSKSLDFGSDAERNTEFTGQGSFSEILNTWRPYLNKGPSDFDTANLITADWVIDLPVGKGKHFFGKSNSFVNAVIGGWKSSGIFRMTSGLPFSFFEPGWTTDWQIESYGVAVDPNLKAKKAFDQNMTPTYFGYNSTTGSHGDVVNNGISNGYPERLPYPGEAGQRNNFRGDGYIDLDSGLSKAWQLGERFGAIKFAWEVYNVTNTNRFDAASIGSGLTSGNLGVAGGLIGGTQAPRRMQFALRYDF